MTGPLTSTHRLVLSILILVPASILSAWLISGYVSLIVAFALCAAIYLLSPVLMPAGHGAMKIRSLSLVGSFALIASYGAWSQLVQEAVAILLASPYIKLHFPWLAGVDFGSAPPLSLLVFAVLIVWIVNYHLSDHSIAGGHPISISDEFPEKRFQEKLESFCSALRQHLETTDREANWSPDYYTELEAEVEVVSTSGSAEKRRLVDLQGAIRSDRATRAFLVLGDPGGGKSVALRKLARDMLGEVGTTGRVPIYINLREWLPEQGRRARTESEKPSVQELERFVINCVKSRGDVFTEDFVDQHFRKLWEYGRLFFLFDSFDEIPELLDVTEESWLLDALSDVLSRFIATNPESRGVLASRMFRRPTQAYLAQKILDIRPMSEERIVQGLGRFPAFTQELRTKLFRDRADLVPLARNPFLMALLGEWVKVHRALPATQAELYESYLRHRLGQCSSKLARAGLTLDEVMAAAREIAWFVFESPAYGLEAPVRVIEEEHASHATAAIVDILSYARIARVTQAENKSFAFVHRRFLEYFVTTRLLEHPGDAPIGHIPTDSRGRDALVLYAQICDAKTAESIAMLCWREISENFEAETARMRAIHSMRFLTDAFRSRRTAVASFEQELADLIRKHVEQGESLLQAKLCLEGTGVLSDTIAVPILNIALRRGNSWLQETAFRACRHLPRLDPNLAESLSRYVIRMPIVDFLASRRTLLFSLSLSESLRGIHGVATLRYRNAVLSAGALPIAALASPVASGLGLFAAGTAYLISLTHEPRPRIRRMVESVPSSQLRGVGLQIYRVLRSVFDAPARRTDWLQVARHSVAIGIVYFGVMLVWVITDVKETSLSRERITVAIPLALLCIDWLVVKDLIKRFVNAFRETTSTIWFALLLAPSFGCMFFVMGRLAEWLRAMGLEWLVALLGGAVVLYPLIEALRDVRKRVVLYIEDRRRLGEIFVANRMSRAEIATAMQSLTLTSSLLKNGRCSS